MVDAMILKARAAMEKIKDYSQEQTDEMVKVCAKAVYDHAEELAIEAVEETQFGTVIAKIGKNKGFSVGLWQQLKGKKSVGVIAEGEEPGIVKIAHPIGVVASITPVTVPNIAPMGNSLLALKGRNAIIISPSPKSKKSSKHTVDLMRAALAKIGAPEDLIQIVPEPTLALSQEVMSKCDVVVATGGPGLVKAAYSSGKPAFGVGAGNTQLIVDDVTDFKQFAEETVASRFYDYGTACVCTQAMICRDTLAAEVEKAMTEEGAFFIADPEKVDRIRELLFIDGKFNPAIAGKSAQEIGKATDIKVPEDAKILVLKTAKHGHDEILCDEKMCPVMLAYSFHEFDEAIDLALANYDVNGKGHTGGIYSNNNDHILKVATKFPVGRLLVNQSTADAGGGPHNSLMITNSIGCGSWGNNSISENLTYVHLLNVQRVAYRIDKPSNADALEHLWD